jgi:hypothetical protein
MHGMFFFSDLKTFSILILVCPGLLRCFDRSDQAAIEQ